MLFFQNLVPFDNLLQYLLVFIILLLLLASVVNLVVFTLVSKVILWIHTILILIKKLTPSS